MNKKTKNIFVVLLVIVLAVLAVNYLDFSGQAQSIVSVSNIDVLNKGQFVQANIVVNNAYESTFFIPKQYMSETFSDGSAFQARKDIELKFKPEQVVCSVSLKPVAKKIAGLYDYVYYTASNTTYFENVPFSYNILRDGTLVKQGTINTFDADSVSFTTSDSGEINITKLGALSNGYVCPSASSFAVINTNTGLRVVDRSQLEYRLNNIELTKVGSCINNLPNLISCLGDYFLIDGTPVPSDYRVNSTTPVCPPNTSCLPLNGVYLDTLNTNKLDYVLPGRSASQSIVVNMNAAFVDGVYVSVPNADIEVSDFWADNYNLMYGEKTNLYVKIKNVGETGDTIRVTPTTNPLNFSISPVTYPLEINAGQEKTAVFEVIATNNIDGTEKVCATASTSGQFGGGISKVECIDLFISKGNSVPLQSCGNNSCDSLLGENYVNCPQDCEKPVVPEDVSRLECTSRPTDFWVLGWNYTPAQAFGLIPSKCDPTYNYGLVVAGVVLIILVFGLGFFTLNFKKGGKKRK